MAIAAAEKIEIIDEEKQKLIHGSTDELAHGFERGWVVLALRFFIIIVVPLFLPANSFSTLQKVALENALTFNSRTLITPFPVAK